MSAVTWLDFSEAQQRKVLEALKGFEEKDTVDDLGFGPIRDAISGTFFPGTSVLQTRAKYFLFIPWIFQRAQNRWPANAVGKAADMERKLISALLESEDLDGVIGRTKGKDLKTLPSAIYWSGLQTFGIFTRRGKSIRQYSRLLARPLRSTEYEGELVDGNQSFWSDLPEPPLDLFAFTKAELALTPKEAAWLSEKIYSAESLSGRPNLLTILVQKIHNRDFGFLEEQNLWDVDLPPVVDVRLRDLAQHSRHFATLVHGSSLMYNMMLAERLLEKGHDVTFGADYESRMQEWIIQSSRNGLESWCVNITDFWTCLESLEKRIPDSAREFVNDLASCICNEGISEFSESASVRRLIECREIGHKKAQARLRNEQRLLAFQGDAGLRPMNFRWNLVCRILRDIADAYEVNNA